MTFTIEFGSFWLGYLAATLVWLMLLGAVYIMGTHS